MIYGKILHYDFKNKDPFGGIHGESKSSAPSPFKIDKDEVTTKAEEARKLDIPIMTRDEFVNKYFK